MAAGHDTFHHVRDFPYFELPFGLRIELPEVFGLQLTKFMVLQVVAVVLGIWIFTGLAKRARGGQPVSGRWWNFWETLALFIRDEVVRPTIGDGHHHDHEDHDAHASGHGHAEAHALSDTGQHPADRYLPFVWSCFFYILFCNLLGAIPWLGSPTGEINVTGALAAVAFGAVAYFGSQALGPIGFIANFAPSIDVPPAMKLILAPMLWVIEVVGILIKHGVLAVRLFANIMAGHTVIAVVLGFIAMVADSGLYYIVLPTSILGQVAIGMLELFVAFLQAYIFAFLSTLFISMCIHEH